MNPLEKIIRGIIEAEGSISVARFMELALQHPEYGYYRNKYPLGAAGDFITSPEISQIFGELIGLWCAEIWLQMGKPEAFLFLELGPGRGTLIQDALRATAKVDGFHKAMKLWLLESDKLLREEQKQKLAAFNPVHVEDLSSLPSLPLIAVANEFFDAMPIQQFVKTGEELRERTVVVEDGQFIFTPSPNLPAREGENFSLVDVEHEQIYETSPVALVFMRQISSHIARCGGAGLVIDYGYAVSSGQSTLQAVSKHLSVDVMKNVGDVDLTAHVDFSALRKVAEHGGVDVFGPVGQGEFLQAMGIEIRAAKLKHNLKPDKAAEIDAAVQRLVDVSQMGSLFKVMGIVSRDVCEVAGFP